MEKRTDKNSYTILFATVMVIIVGSMLAFLATYLKPQIDENKRLEKQQNILYALGINENDEKSVVFISTKEVAEKFSEYIVEQRVILGEGSTESEELEEAYLIDLKKEAAQAKKGAVRRLPLFIGEKDGEKFYIVPMLGKGLWDAVWGYVALDKDLVVEGIFFDHKGETPGLGANINQRFFMDDFKGEHILEGDTFKGITVAKGNADPKNKRKEDFKVDAIAGATITGNGLTAMIKKDLGMYMPYLQTLKNN
ncbi:MAG: Na(+)-translocating NADH-quinone reductase subunit C [Flavobacteriaceae bacterium]